MYKIYVNGYFIGIEALTSSEVRTLNNDTSIALFKC